MKELNNQKDCEHCRKKYCSEYIEKENFPVFKSILKSIRKWFSKWLMVLAGYVILIFFWITIGQFTVEAGIFDSILDFFPTSSNSTESEWLNLIVTNFPEICLTYVIIFIVVFIFEFHKKTGLMGMIRALIVSLIFSVALKLIHDDISTMSAQQKIFMILLFLFAVPTFYSAWSQIKNAHKKLEKLKKKVLGKSYSEEENYFDSMLKQELQEFDFYTTTAFYMNVLENSATMISAVMIVCFSMYAGLSESQQIIEMMGYVDVMFIYWFSMLLIFYFFSLFISDQDGILLSPTYKKYKIDEIIAEINEEKQKLQASIKSVPVTKEKSTKAR